MDRKRIAVAGVLAVMFGAGLTIAGCSSDDSSSGGDQGSTTASESSGGAYGSDRSAGGDDASSDSAATDDKASDKQKSGGNSAQAGQYVEYSPELVESTPGDKLLFFHADWCSQCVSLEGDIEASGVPDGVTIFKVDYDSNQDLRQEYGVTIQTTVVKVDDDGEKIDSYVAYEDPTIDNVEAALLR